MVRSQRNQNQSRKQNRRTQTLTLSFLIERAQKRAKTRIFNNLPFYVNYVFVIFLNKPEFNIIQELFCWTIIFYYKLLVSQIKK